MRQALSIFLVVSTLVGIGYWYNVAYSTCRTPLSYSIGSVDPRFELTTEEIRLLISEVESEWEDHTGKNLFTYDADGELVIDFIFDDRQQLALEEHELREVLNYRESVSGSIKEAYDNLLKKYETLRETYRARVDAYKGALATHNGEVAHWNTQGGAPQDVYERLNQRQRELDTERKELITLADKLNMLVDEVNALGEQGNKTVLDYNTDVQKYNNQFNHEREFTQGDYQDGYIHIYQFDDRDELKVVLAHEMGHALSLDHVEDEGAIMYYLMGGQSRSLSFTSADIEEFERVCGSK